jgi:hypothetical protein
MLNFYNKTPTIAGGFLTYFKRHGKKKKGAHDTA